MQKGILRLFPFVFVAVPAAVFAQAPKAATYITDEEVKTVNSQPGIDRTIRVVNIGSENFAVGVIHRGATGGGARGTAAGGGGAATTTARGGTATTTAGGGAGRGGAQQGEPCGEQASGGTPPAGGTPG